MSVSASGHNTQTVKSSVRRGEEGAKTSAEGKSEGPTRGNCFSPKFSVFFRSYDAPAPNFLNYQQALWHIQYERITSLTLSFPSYALMQRCSFQGSVSKCKFCVKFF